MAPTRSSTLPPEIPPERLRRARTLRRAGLGVLVLFVGAGLLNRFGSTSATVTDVRGDLRLTVTYPSRTRPALPVKWALSLTSADGFSGPIRVEVNRDYFGYLDFNNLYPAPDTTENRGDYFVFTFPAPKGATLNVLFDGRAQPGRAGIARGVTRVVGDDGDALAEVDYETEVFP